MSRLLIRNGTIVNENERYKGYILIENERIAEIGPGDYPSGPFDGTVIDATGLLVLPGVIDDQVHFREPGLTYKADIGSESAAAVAGGVTSFMDMPNVKPPSVSRALLEQRFERLPKPRPQTTRSIWVPRTTTSTRSAESIRNGSAESNFSWLLHREHAGR